MTALSAGLMNPSSATSPFVLTTAPGGTGKVYQLDFGTISGFTAAGGNLFTSANAGTTNFMVLAQTQADANYNPEFQATYNGTLTSSNVTASGITTASTNIQSEIATWQSDTTVNGDAKDTTGSKPWAVKNAPLYGGGLGLTYNFSGGLNTALTWYDFANNAAGVGKTVVSTYNNGLGNGYWYLSSSGDLTYDIAAPSAVPSRPPSGCSAAACSAWRASRAAAAPRSEAIVVSEHLNSRGKFT